MATNFKFPPLILLLDLVGMVFIGVGLAEYFASVNWLPATLRFEYFEFIMIFLGFLMTIPLVVWTIKNRPQANQD